MPYITEERKQALCGGAHNSFVDTPQNAGELNFVLTMVVLDYVETRGMNYQFINDVCGALTECRVEFERRIVRPYEDVKAALNGDVYRPILERLARELQAQADEHSA